MSISLCIYQGRKGQTGYIPPTSIQPVSTFLGCSRRAPAEFTDGPSQIPMCCQHKNSCHLWILQLCFVIVWTRLVFKTTCNRYKYTCH